MFDAMQAPEPARDCAGTNMPNFGITCTEQLANLMFGHHRRLLSGTLHKPAGWWLGDVSYAKVWHVCSSTVTCRFRSLILRYNSGKNGHPVGISTWTLQYLPLTDCLTTYLYLLPIPCVHTPYTTQTEALDLIFRCILHYCCLWMLLY